ncbi:beta/gamma crystallin domain-containing protein [Amycolatopsis azurea]|uniref:Oxidoreductase n=1 Tax=Amycolatopsis azurea DSM 43854 TaxID=1238180 RepID=M2NKH2_9PSEU|nr:beta/gamma crystallin domain-containing protein [Amycolatopsis azurea]EMD22649.1 Toxin-Like Protein Sklp [Amycolatopsis azurea DSM 43854]OOC00652.1 oxidoreductase [Amycolatopsis azurea DSM 43854]
MISSKKSAGRIAAMAAAAAAMFSMVVPTGTSFAIDHIPCRAGENFLKIWSHLDGRDSVDCYANRGRIGFGGWWVDKIETGNNDLIYSDANGDSVRVNRWTIITYPNRPPRVNYIEIL